MTKSNSSKRALVTSVLAIIMCVAMLVGTTFAWFTDTASTAVNKIVAGNLDVELEYWDGSKYVDAKDVSLFSENTLWEPGHTEVVYLKILNKGSLALKYRLSTVDTREYQYSKNGEGKNIYLSDYLEIGTVDGKNAAEGIFEKRDEAIAAAAANLVSYDSYTKDNVLLPAADGGESADYVAFVVHMPETVGNEANWVENKKIWSYGAPWISFNLGLTATQASYEFDSFDEKYDDGIAYPIVGSNNAKDAGTILNKELKKKNSDILLSSDAEYHYSLEVDYKTTINLNGNNLTTHGQNALLEVTGTGDLTITGNGVVDASDIPTTGTYSGIAVRVKAGGKLTIKGGTFIADDTCSCIYDEGGEIKIEGGFFKCEGPFNGKYYVVNQLDSNRGSVSITGGTFVNYNPEDGDDPSLGVSFVADGYKVVSETQANGDIWYTVVAE